MFIDGVSFKNDVIDGGVIGQDSSRGNPFPQSAVQEFQVLTQNFKAEYEKAASAIITAVTKSGGNRFTGELFSYYQDKALVENEAIVRDASNIFVKGETTPKPAYERWQWGARARRADRPRPHAVLRVVRGEPAGSRRQRARRHRLDRARRALVQRLRAFEGLFISPFREKLLFAKTSFQPGQGQQAEITYNWRNETDIRGFGGQGASNSYQTAENVRNRVDSLQGKWQIARPRFLNEAYLSYQRYRWNPTPENPDIIGENFSGLMRIGGRDTEQFIVQQRVSLQGRLLTVPEVARQPHGQGRRRRQSRGLRREQEVQRQPAVHLSRRHQLGLSGERQLRSRQPGSRARATTSSACSPRTTGPSGPG